MVFPHDAEHCCGKPPRLWLRAVSGISSRAVARYHGPNKPTIIELDMGKLEDTLRRAEEKLDEKDYAMLKALTESYAYLSGLVGDKTTTIARLRKLLFGSKTEKTAAVVGGPQGSGAGRQSQDPASPGRKSLRRQHPKPRAAADVEAVPRWPRTTLPGADPRARSRPQRGRMPTPAPSRSRSPTRRSSRAILARHARRARSTRRAARA